MFVKFVVLVRFGLLAGRHEPRQPVPNPPQRVPGAEHRRSGAELTYLREHHPVVAYLIQRRQYPHAVAERHGDPAPDEPKYPLPIVHR